MRNKQCLAGRKAKLKTVLISRNGRRSCTIGSGAAVTLDYSIGGIGIGNISNHVLQCCADYLPNQI